MKIRAAWFLSTAMMLTGCSSAHPVLYENDHLKTVGKEAADQDINACREAAESAGAKEGSGKAGGVAKRTAVGAGVGAASGAVGGAISGSPGLGSAIGAASGAVWGLLMGLFNAGSSQPSQAYTGYVNRCLEDKGYEVTGWQ
jgi:Glycine-zipper domain